MSKSKEQFLHSLYKAKLQREIRLATRKDRLRDAEMYPTFGKTNSF